jgi:CRP/FNR family cyclic AMP-dependent transcriptional regulator
MNTGLANKTQGLMQIQKILHLTKEVYFKPGEYIFREGEQDLNFYLVLKGEIEISKKTSEGQQKVIAELKAGEILGEGVLSGTLIKPASAQAISSAILLSLSKTDFDGLLSKDPGAGVDFLLSVLGSLNDRINRTNIKLISLYEINKLMGVYRDDINMLSKALIHRLLAITDSRDGIVALKNPFEEKYRRIYSSAGDMDVDQFENFNRSKSQIVANGNSQYLFVNLKNVGYLVLRRKKSDALYEDDQLRLLMLIAEQAGNTIEAASRRASDKARNILQQKKFIL